MKFDWNFNLSDELLLKFKASKVDLNILQEYLLQQDIKLFLSYYYKKSGANVEKVHFNEIQFLKSDEGTIETDLTINFYNACLNIDSNDKDKMKLEFKILESEKILYIKGPYWPEREPDEL